MLMKDTIQMLSDLCPMGEETLRVSGLVLAACICFWLTCSLALLPLLLHRLLHYFRGRHHLEEIMYNENMRRSQLLMLFDKFRSVLVVTSHEDPVISVFQSLLKWLMAKDGNLLHSPYQQSERCLKTAGGDFSSVLPCGTEQVCPLHASVSHLLPVVAAEAGLCEGFGACCRTTWSAWIPAVPHPQRGSCWCRAPPRPWPPRACEGSPEDFHCSVTGSMSPLAGPCRIRSAFSALH